MWVRWLQAGNQISDFNFPPRNPRSYKPWSRALVLKTSTGNALQASFGSIYESLPDGLLKWRPSCRLTGQQILMHPFFEDLKAPSTQYEALPRQLFEYTDEELAVMSNVVTDTAAAVHAIMNQITVP